MSKVDEIMELMKSYGSSCAEDEEYKNAEGWASNSENLEKLIQGKLVSYLPKEHLSKEQVLEKYGDVPLLFTYYYKHVFSFRGEIDGVIIRAKVGYRDGDVYRYEMLPNQKETLKGGNVDYANVFYDDDFVIWEGEV